jgi:soluble lytic murein transglycosylase-like protein
MRLFVSIVLVWALTWPQDANAQEADDLIAPYAQALRAFNPRLTAQTSAQLAGRTIAEADRAGLDARLVVALVAVESRWHPAAVSNAGALGLGQLMPATAQRLGVDALDPTENLHGTIVHLARLVRRYARFDRETQYSLALAAYNAGEGAVVRFGGVPPYRETQAYVHDVVALWRRLAGR